MNNELEKTSISVGGPESHGEVVHVGHSTKQSMGHSALEGVRPIQVTPGEASDGGLELFSQKTGEDLLHPDEQRGIAA